MKSLSGRDQGNLDVEIYNRFFKDIKDGVCIECGALDGLHLSVCNFFEINFNWKCINIEPGAGSFKRLETNRPKSINLNFALSDKEETRFFGENVNRPKKSCLVQRDVDEKRARGFPTVQCLTYKGLINDVLIPKFGIDHIDLFVLDVESNEVPVIAGMKGAKIMPSVLCSEITGCSKDIIEKIEGLLPEYKLIFSMRYNSVFLKREGV